MGEAKRLTAPDRVCLIGGTGRSGTTILKRVFAEHPDVVSVPELRFAIDPDGLVDFYRSFENDWSPYHWDRKFRALRRLLRDVAHTSLFERALSYVNYRLQLYSWVPFSLVPRYAGTAVLQYSPHFIQLTEDFLRRLEGLSFSGQWTGTKFLEENRIWSGEAFPASELAGLVGDFWRKVMADMCEAQGCSVYLDDNTWSILWFDSISALLPEARLVHIFRDPRDVVTSYGTKRWAPHDPKDAACWYRAIIRRWFVVREKVSQEKLHEISLERLVREREQVCHELCEFWDIPWHDNLLDIPLDKAHTGRWLRELNLSQQREVQAILQEEIVNLGYDLKRF